MNVYDKDTCLRKQMPKPQKAIMNLTTSCTYSTFNPATEILALSSNLTEKAVKLVSYVLINHTLVHIIQLRQKQNVYKILVMCS